MVEEVIRRWRLEIAECIIYRTFYTWLQNFEMASEYRERIAAMEKVLEAVNNS